MTTQPALYPITVKIYHRMAEIGLFDEDPRRTELIHAKIMIMPPIGSAHADKVNQLARFFNKTLPEEFIVSIQNPVHLSDTSEPEPDVALLRPRLQPYREAHPRPEDILLLIEVADTSLNYDRSVKVPLYAAHGITEVWLWDVLRQQLEIFREPIDKKYRTSIKPCKTEKIALSAAPIVIDLQAVL